MKSTIILWFKKKKNLKNTLLLFNKNSTMNTELAPLKLQLPANIHEEANTEVNTYEQNLLQSMQTYIHW